MATNEGIIDQILKQDKEAFDRAISDPQYKIGLALPSPAYRYLLIPQRLLEISRRPAEVILNINSRSDIAVWGNIFIGPTKLLSSHLISYTGNPESPAIFVEDYTDEDYIRGKGVATSFYQRLHECAAQMGYRFIYGFNMPENVEFFTKKLGRVLLGDTNPEIWQYLALGSTDLGWGTHLDSMTIDFLRPEDKEEFSYTGQDTPRERWWSYFLKLQ